MAVQDYSDITNFTDFINRNRLSNRPNQDLRLNAGLSRDAASSFVNKFGPAAGAGTALGYGNLLELLQGQGRTDPALFNRQIQTNQRGTQAQQRAVRGELAGRGLQNSGLGMALQGAVGASGVQRDANIRASEAQLAEQRRREDLQLFRDLILGPSIDLQALYSGQYASDRANKTQKDAASLGAISAIISAFL